MSESGNQREFIGCVWQDDDGDRTGVLVLADDVSEAAEMVRETHGNLIRISLWNEDDADKPR